MSQNVENMTGAEFAAMAMQAKRERIRSGITSGPEYCEDAKPGKWFDQAFGRDIEPAGAVELPESLRVGSTQNGLDVIFTASHANRGEMAIAAGATITLTTYVSDRPHGEFEAVGPSICVTAPEGGISVAPDCLAWRIAIGNFKKPWLKVKAEFSGSISGGTLDCYLSYMAR